MEYARFADHYTPSAIPSIDLPPVQYDLEECAIAMGEQVHTYLKGESTLRAVGMAGLAYADAALHHTSTLMTAISSSTLKDQPWNTSYSNAASHLTHGMYHPYYFALANTEKLSKNEYTINHARAAVSLALTGTNLSWNRLLLSQEKFKTANMPYKLFSKRYETYRSVSTGYGTELDTFQVLLDIARQRPELIVLPSLPQFERNTLYKHHKSAKVNNADILLLNAHTKRILGLQVKTHVKQEDMETYDTAIVHLISGREDFDNTKAVRLSPVSSDKTIIAWPGYMALHRLAVTPNTSPVMRTFEPSIRKNVLYQRSLAQAALGNAAPRFRTAKQRLSARLLHHLDGPTAV